MVNYKTVFQNAIAEDSIKKSKFLAHVKPVDTEEEAIQFIDTIKKEHWKANHNVPVYCIGPKYEIQRYSDDGEPSGTAGVPILEMLKNEGITNVVVVITRYFGGIKLGTGGLVRAYTQSAKHGLTDAIVVEKLCYEKVSYTFNYNLHGKIENMIKDLEYYIQDEILFTDSVEMIGYVNPEMLGDFELRLSEISSGSAILTTLGEEYLTAKDNQVMK